MRETGAKKKIKVTPFGGVLQKAEAKIRHGCGEKEGKNRFKTLPLSARGKNFP